MPLPPALTLIPMHVAVIHTDEDGTPATGDVFFGMPYTLRDAAGGKVLGRRRFRAKLVNGEATIDLPATDDPDISPSGWTYTVTPVTSAWNDPPFEIEVPYDTVGTLELGALAPAVTPTAVATYALLGHSHTLDQLSDVDVAAATNGQFLGKVAGVWTGVTGGGGSAPDATTSTKGIVKLAGDLSGTADLPTVPALSGKAPLVHTHTAAAITDFATAVNALIAAVVDAAPASLDTLNELAAALGDDPNFAATITTLIGTKQPLDADLTTIAGLSPAANDVLQYIAGAWASRTPAQLKSTLALAKADVGLSSVDNTSDLSKPISTATQTALDAKFDPGDDILALYGYHSCTSHISSFRSEFGQNNEIWIARILVRAGRAISKIGTFVKTAGTLGGGGTNGFAIASDDGSTLLFSVDNDNLWTSAGEVSVNLGGSAIAAQTTDKYYRVQMSVHGYSAAPSVLLNQGDHAVLSDYQGRARFANASVGYQSGGGYNPVTFGTSTGGFYPLIMLG